MIEKKYWIPRKQWTSWKRATGKPILQNAYCKWQRFSSFFALCTIILNYPLTTVQNSLQIIIPNPAVQSSSPLLLKDHSTSSLQNRNIINHRLRARAKRSDGRLVILSTAGHFRIIQLHHTAQNTSFHAAIHVSHTEMSGVCVHTLLSD